MSIFVVDETADWDIAKLRLESLQRSAGFLFRGQGDSRWDVKSTFERDAADAGVRPADWFSREFQLLWEFQRRAHHYIASPPAREDDLEWLAMLRHYGGPCRLVDVTRSGYVAAFFAMESATDDAAIWAFNGVRLHQSSVLPLLGDLPQGEQPAQSIFKDVFDRGYSGVITGDPERMNERMAAQQGLFLMGIHREKTFMENLAAGCGLQGTLPPPTHFADREKNAPPVAIFKLILKKSVHKQALRELRTMNITAASLYPGIDGFARSLSTRFRSNDMD